ncbi:tyrosyl-DNA phosphodiesterase 2-like isoform X1 [Pristis pectinata]|uniref:tyrosyl-DNA phosphodiesterase 2-like isoform X1 n=1 Tax=Pristis pectinata TaxID=685728 RepID=UPI00223DB661|nr:tyrosyl-DNA phosphodiesterase 2-like isoform X1 [Pristis pectinata]
MSEPQCKRPRLSGSDCQAAASPQIDGEEEEKEDEGVLRRCREAVCAEFAVVTGTDESVAQCYLAKNEWLLERALNSYFEAAVQPSCSAMEAASQLMNGADFQRCIDLTDESSVQTSKEDGAKSQVDESTISLLTWNIDGLDASNLPERARGVFSCLALYNPDIVFLQEVIEPYYNYLKKRAVSYTLIPANNDGYYTTIMLKKSRVKLLKQEIIAFPTTTMMRNLLIVQANIAGNELCLMTSHLESTKEHSRERIKQLGTVLKKMREVPDCATVIFGGDTNLRDKEVKSFGGLPANISDVWEFLNKPEHCRYTWDTTTNNNLKASYACRLRFDRVFFRASKEGQIVPKEMSLMGQDKLECGRFCSDHWGLLCDFDVIL